MFLRLLLLLFCIAIGNCYEVEKRRFLDKLYSNILKMDFVVADVKTTDGEVQRHINRGANLDLSETAMNLIPPLGQEFETADTTKWRIDSKNILFKQLLAMVSAPFVLSSLSLEGEGEGESVLEIGLGGGTIDTLITDAKPKINMTSVELDETIITIARKWFGVVPSASRRQIAGDGIKVMREYKATGSKVDVLFFDTSDGDALNPAPAAPFLERSVVEDGKEILKPNGVFIVNIAYTKKEDRDARKHTKDISIFTKVFPSCLRLWTTTEINEALICQLHSITLTEEELHKRFKEVGKALHLPDFSDVLRLARL